MAQKLKEEECKLMLVAMTTATGSEEDRMLQRQLWYIRQVKDGLISIN